MLQNPLMRSPAPGPIQCDAGIAPPWDVIKRKGGLEYQGQFAVYDSSGEPYARVAGRVVEWHGLPVEVYLFNPPKELRLHPHGRCLQLVQPGGRWFKLHFERPARTFDQARAYVEHVLAEAVTVPNIQPRIPTAIPHAPAQAMATAMTNAPTLQFARRHHWLWIVRRLQPLVRLSGLIIAGFVTVWVLGGFGADVFFYLPPLAVIGILSITPLFRLARVLVDWYRRSIRLYSDGRLDYTEGIVSRHCTSVSTRFGAIRFHYDNELTMVFDCADIELPFNGGTIEAVPNFRRFWEIAQGRE